MKSVLVVLLESEICHVLVHTDKNTLLILQVLLPFFPTVSFEGRH